MINSTSNIQTASTTWEVESLRWTAFTTEVTEPKELRSWWPAISRLPRGEEIHVKNASYVESGSVDETRLTIQYTPGRIDLRVSMKPPEDQSVQFGNLLKIEAAFRKFLDRWFKLPSCPIAKRIAVGCILVHRVENRRDGYHFLSPILKNVVAIDWDNSKDFLYQINRPRMSGTVKGLELNRLTKWSVGAHSIVTIGPAMATMGPVLPGSTVARLELDLSSSQDAVVIFRPKQQQKLLLELLELGFEIAHRGDIP